MNFKYPDSEKEDLVKITALMKDWKKTISKAEPIKWRDDNKYYQTKDWFSEDGFFPYYFDKKPKILFVAREDRDNWNTVKEWMAIFHGKHERVGKASYVQVFRILLRILYGIKNDFPEYKEIPQIMKFANTVGKPDGLSFAIMELSKYGNSNNNSTAINKKLVERFLKDSKLDERNYFEEEMKLLNPDLIITMDLFDLSAEITDDINKYIFKKSDFSLIRKFSDNKAHLYKLKLNGKYIPTIDMYHFSSRHKGIEKYFYNPFVSVLKSKTFKKEFPNFFK